MSNITKDWLRCCNEKQPVLCWVYDYDERFALEESVVYLDLVVGFNDDDEYPYKTVNNEWLHAKPVSQSEVDSWVWED